MGKVRAAARTRNHLNKKEKFHILRRVVDNYILIPKGAGKVVALVFIESLAMSVSFFLSIYLSKVIGFNQAQVGFLISVMLAGTCAGSFLSGYLTGFIAPRIVTSIGFVLFGVALLLMTTLKNFSLLMPSVFLCGVGGVFMMIANLTALIRLAKDDAMKNRMIVLQGVVFNATVSIAAGLLSFLSNRNIENLFICLAVTLFISAYFTLNFGEKVNNESQGKKRYKITPNISMLCTIVPMIACYGVVFSVVRTFFAVDTGARFSNPWLVWMVLSANPFLVVFVQPVLIGLLKNKSSMSLMITGSVLLCGGYLLFGVSSLLIPSLFFISIAAVGEMIFSPISKNMASSSMGKNQEGMGLAVWKVTYYLSGIIGASLSGVLGNSYGHAYAWGLSLPAMIIMCVCGLVFMISRQESKG